jgi:uncharacterized protein (UPF0332 family)
LEQNIFIMKKTKFDWKIWLDNKKELENSFKLFIKKEIIKEEKENKFLSKSHLKKAEDNFRFSNFLKDNNKFYDWIIVGCYYTIYHSSLALITKKGLSSKNHLATLCTLIKVYYNPNKELSKEDIELVSKSTLEKQEICYFMDVKEKREIASYGISEDSNKEESEILLKKTIIFLNKTREILE